jgi:hypothetical protein
MREKEGKLFQKEARYDPEKARRLELLREKYLFEESIG